MNAALTMKDQFLDEKPDWYRYYPSDWRYGCQTLNLEEEGLYSRCCAYMYETTKPLPDDDAVASRVLRVQIQKYRKVLDALIRKGKLIRSQGQILNERVMAEIDWSRAHMLRQREANEKRSKTRLAMLREAADQVQLSRENRTSETTPPPGVPHGVPHGVPEGVPMGVPHGVTAKKSNEINESCTVSPQVDPTVHLDRVRVRDNNYGKDSEVKQQTQSPELTLSEPSSDVYGSSIKKKIAYSAKFEEFWQAYPDRTNNSKVQAWKAWKKLGTGDQRDAVEGLVGYKRFLTKRVDHPVAHVATYLNQRRWESYLAEPQKPTSKSVWWSDPDAVAKLPADRWREGIRRYANGLWPIDKLGPPPGSDQCRVPQKIVDEFRLTEIYTPDGVKRLGATAPSETPNESPGNGRQRPGEGVHGYGRTAES